MATIVSSPLESGLTPHARSTKITASLQHRLQCKLQCKSTRPLPQSAYHPPFTLLSHHCKIRISSPPKFAVYPPFTFPPPLPPLPGFASTPRATPLRLTSVLRTCSSSCCHAMKRSPYSERLIYSSPIGRLTYSLLSGILKPCRQIFPKTLWNRRH